MLVDLSGQAITITRNCIHLVVHGLPSFVLELVLIEQKHAELA